MISKYLLLLSQPVDFLLLFQFLYIFQISGMKIISFPGRKKY